MLIPSAVIAGGAPAVFDCINSIQQVSITIAAGATTGTATISAVGATSFVVYQGQTSVSAVVSLATIATRVELTNSTTVTATRQTLDVTNAVTIKAVVIDPTAVLVDSVQQGTITLTAATSNTATISSVDTSRSAVFYLGQSAVSTGINTSIAGVSLTNATTVTATAGASSTLTVGYVVVQFAAAVINSVQPFSAPIAAGANLTKTQTITSVNTANTMLAWGGMEGSSTVLARWAIWATLTNSTTITYTRTSTTSANIAAHITAIEFKAGVLKSMQRGSIAVASTTSNTGTVSSVSTSKSIANYLGYSTTATTPDEAFITLTQTNATTLTAAKNTGGSSTSTVGYEVPEFN